MKRTAHLAKLAGLGLVLAALLLPAATRAEEAAGQSGFINDLVNDLSRVGKKLSSLAEAVPADQFGWSPNEEVRTVSEVYMHVVGTNLFLPAALGAPAPEGIEITGSPFELMRQWEKEVTSRDEVVARLRESFAYAEQAIRAIPDSDLDTEVNVFGFPASKRAYLLILLTHAHEHLGQSIAYARSLGVVPPWSRPASSDSG